jgi:uncharacterized protein (TIGR03086 family)
MPPDLLDLYGRASTWVSEKVAGASDQLDARTPCEEWDVRTLLNHMLDTQQYFLSSARGEDASPPSPTPPEVLSGDPAGDFTSMQAAVREAFGADGVIEKTGPALGVAFSDQLLHGWDLARATGQDATMPDGLAEAAYEQIHGKFTDEQRKGLFKPEIAVGSDASPQDRLLAYTGRDPSA